ncbi:cupin domain-containing protein [Caballeronia sp. LZ001]|uniref:cupin domain-containing protein n=1 Tax=Caballeronia sp. LZ001 TaxID=3038553 RepID=UPI0028570689|nr:cupin domain-containing protein [Caballeronia sp. LZ001]MDR5804866.1 cupin domain-containing protein [Caballeronia sp. LZ001]
MSSPDTTESKSTERTRRGITIFREKEAPLVHETGIMVHHSPPNGLAGIQRMRAAGLDDGNVLKCLYRSPDPNGFTLVYVWFKGNFPLPVHTHDTDCLYYIISGEIHLGKNVLTSGDGFFLPAATAYTYQVGPQGVELLEFRGANAFDIVIRDAPERAWERMVAACTENRESWKDQRPPMREPKV